MPDPSHPSPALGPWNLSKFENVHQIGGIQLARLAPCFGGDAEGGGRVALVDTGAGLRFTVALDRGGDIVDAFYQQHSLTWLSPVGLTPPSPAFHQGSQWIRNWPGGLVTTCGPLHIGHARTIAGLEQGMHGRYSNLPAHVEMVVNPDPHRHRFEMLLTMVIRDVSPMGPHLEIRRTIQTALGASSVIIFDQVTNRGDQTVPHHWLYHVNFGYPLLDAGARFIYRGPARYWQLPLEEGHSLLRPRSAEDMAAIKEVAEPMDAHRGTGERGLLVETAADADGDCHVGLINDRLGLGVELAYPSAALPRLANWQHYGPRGAYVSALEPFHGSLLGPDHDHHPKSSPTLQPGQTQRYRLRLNVLTSPADLAALREHDGPVEAA